MSGKVKVTCLNCGHKTSKTFRGGFDDVRLAFKKFKEEYICKNCGVVSSQIFEFKEE